MSSHGFVLGLAFALAACECREPPELITPTGAGPVRLGMVIAEVRRALPKHRLLRGSDGDGVVLVDVLDGEELVLQLFTGDSKEDVPFREDAVVEHIRVFRPEWVTAQGVHVGMLVSEVEKRLGRLSELRRSDIESREFASFVGQAPEWSFLIGHGDSGRYPSEAGFTHQYRSEPKIEGIWIDRIGPAATQVDCPPDGRPPVEVRFERPETGERLLRAEPLPGGGRGRARVLASAQVRRRLAIGPTALLSSLETLVAPWPLPPELEGKDVTKEVSWGVLVSHENLDARLLDGRLGCERQEAKVFEIDLDEILREGFTRQDDNLWLWALRVEVRLLDREGRLLAEGRGQLDLPPPEVTRPPSR